MCLCPAAAAAAPVLLGWQVYSEGLSGLPLPPATRDTLSLLRGRSAALTHNWVATGAALLTAVSSCAGAPPVTHVLVTGDHLVTAAAKLLLWGLSEHFPLAHVYSAARATKLHCFKRIQSCWGSSAR
jgi:hypothetical protein